MGEKTQGERRLEEALAHPSCSFERKRLRDIALWPTLVEVLVGPDEVGPDWIRTEGRMQLLVRGELPEKVMQYFEQAIAQDPEYPDNHYGLRIPYSTMETETVQNCMRARQ